MLYPVEGLSGDFVVLRHIREQITKHILYKKGIFTGKYTFFVVFLCLVICSQIYFVLPFESNRSI